MKFRVLSRYPQEGFSLTELMIGLALAGVLAAAAYGFMHRQARTAGKHTQQSQQLRDSQRAKFLFQTDVQQAGFDPRALDLGRDRVLPLFLGSNDRLSLQGDFNESGDLGDEGDGQSAERIYYQYDADLGEVQRNGVPFLTDVSDFSFSYRDGNNQLMDPSPDADTAELLKVRKIEIHWQQDNGGDRPELFEFAVTLRNTGGSS